MHDRGAPHHVHAPLAPDELPAPAATPWESRARPAAGWTMGIVASAPLPALLVDSEGVILQGNARASAVLGVARDALAGLLVTRFLLPDPTARDGPVLQRTIMRADTSCFPADVLVLPTSEGGDGPSVVLIRDVTDREHREDALRYRTALLESQNEAALDGILVVDAGGRVASANRRFMAMWRLPVGALDAPVTPAEMLDVALDDVHDAAALLAPFMRPAVHADVHARDEVRFRDGRVVERWSTPVHGAEGEYYGCAWYFRDVTDRKEREREIARAYAKLKDSENARVALISHVAHDLATPLTPILIQLDLLAREARPDGGRGPRAFEVIARNLRHLERLVSELKELAQVNAADVGCGEPARPE